MTPGHTATLPIDDYESMRVAQSRYEYVRALTPEQFADLWERAAREDKPFDFLVDAAIVERRTAQQQRWKEECKRMKKGPSW